MIIVYDSRSGYGEAFAKKIGFPVQSVAEEISSPFVLVTRNIGLGKIPESTSIFLDKYQHLAKGVVVNGMKRYGPFFCGAAKKIEAKYRLPILAKIELAGNDEDVVLLKQAIEQL